MRISADKNDPDYLPGLSEYATVKIDGQAVQGVITADEETGTALVYLYDNDGEICKENGVLRTAEIEGHITITLPTLQ